MKNHEVNYGDAATPDQVADSERSRHVAALSKHIERAFELDDKFRKPNTLQQDKMNKTHNALIFLAKRTNTGFETETETVLWSLPLALEERREEKQGRMRLKQEEREKKLNASKNTGSLLRLE